MPRASRREIALAVGASLVVLAIVLARPPGWEVIAGLGATLLPATFVLYATSASRLGSALDAAERALAHQRDELARETGELERSRTELTDRLSELVTLNELGTALTSTRDLDELLDRGLRAVVDHLRFDRALVLLVDGDPPALSGGRSIGGTPEMQALVGTIHLPMAETRSTLVRLALADGPMLFRSVDEDDYEPNRSFAAALGVGSFLGTPLVTKGRTVGVLAVDNRSTGRELDRRVGPLLYTLGNLLASAIENARLYAEIEAHSRELEARVEHRTAQLAEALEAAQAARAMAEAASATKSSFLASASHELRTPLTSVVGFAKLVRKRLDEVVFPATATDDARVARAVRQVGENLGIIVEEGERLTALVNDVLDLQKIEAGRMVFRADELDVADVVDRSTAATGALFETTGLVLVRRVEPGLPRIVGDHDRLVQVVINLLSNAVKFTRAGSVTVAAAHAGDAIVVSVTDTGAGIDPADHERIFEQFAQAEDTVSDTPRGTGLGLPIARRIVEHHGGRMWLESRPGEGSTFSFSLPIALSTETGELSAAVSRTN